VAPNKLVSRSLAGDVALVRRGIVVASERRDRRVVRLLCDEPLDASDMHNETVVAPLDVDDATRDDDLAGRYAPSTFSARSTRQPTKSPRSDSAKSHGDEGIEHGLERVPFGTGRIATGTLRRIRHSKC
jgi:hypothetical protein